MALPKTSSNSYRVSTAGFTLIEMLVVVAVIGILSSVLLNALGPAKDKAKDSRIMQEVNQVRSLAETLYDGVALQGGELAIRKSTPALNYVAYSRLNSQPGTSEVPLTNYYCVDSLGR